MITHSQEGLENSERLLRLVTSGARVGLVVVNHHYEYLFANEAYGEVLGLPPGDIIGRRLSDIISDSWPLIKPRLDRALAGERVEFEVTLPPRMGIGLPRTFALICEPHPEPGGEPTVVIVVADISARRRAEEAMRESELRYRTLFESIDEGFCVIEMIFADDGRPVDYRFLEVNGAFERQTGLRGATGRRMRELAPELEERWFRTYGHVALTGKPVRFQNHAAALHRWYDVYAFRLDPPESRKVAVLFTDISARKHAEEALAGRAREQSFLFKFTDQLQRAGSLNDVYNLALDCILKVLKCTRASILLFDDSKTMKFVAWRDLSETYRNAVQGHTPWRPEDTNPQPVYNNDIGAADVSPALKEIARREGIRALAFIPLMAEGKLIGKFMAYYNAPHAFSSEELDLALTIARQLGFVVERKRAEEAKARLASIVEFSEDAIVSQDLNSIILSWNRGAERVFGYTAAEAVGRPITLIIPNERHHEEESIMERVRHRESVEHHETIRRCKDGTLLNISLTVSPITDAAGKVVAASKIARNITAHKQAEAALRESEDRYRTLVKQVKDYAIFRMDKSGRPTSWNEGVSNVFGFSEAEFLGRDITKIIFTPEDVAAGAPERELQQAAETGTVNNDRWLRHADGTRFFARGATTGLRDAAGGHVGFTMVVRDATAAKKAEEALAEAQARLQEYTTTLEQTVAERTQDLRATNEQLEAFVYSIAHDLRTPLRALTGYSQLLSTGRAGALSGDARELLLRIQASSEFMDKLLLDLLAYGRAARAEMDLGPVDVQKAWETARFQCAAQIEETQATVETRSRLPIVRAHEGTLGQCLANLLSNALKFVAPRVRPKIQFYAEGHGDWVRLWLEDNGLGIPPEHQDRVFRVFERLHGSRYVGTGIGLSIVRKGVERMGGHVGLESQPGKGSRFWIELPKAA